MTRIVRDSLKKLLKEEQQVPKQKNEEQPSQDRTYKKYTEQDKEGLFYLVHEKGMSTHAAALELGINPRTAQNWVKKEQDALYNQEHGYTSNNPSSETPDETRTYKKYTPQDKENLIYLIRERGMSTRNAALQLGINPSTAQTWVKKEQDEQDARVYRQTEERAAESSSSHSSSSPRTSAELSPVQLSPMNATQKYKKYTPQDKENLLYLIRERGMNTRSAALQLGINPSTAQTWVKREQDTRLYPQTEERAADPDNHATGYASESEGELESPVTPQRTIEQQSPMNATHTYKHYTPQDKESLFYLIREKGMSTTAAATQLGINPSTAQSWVRKERDYAKETGQTSKLLEKQLDREESIEKNIPFVNTSNHGQQEDRRSATPQVVPNSVEPTATEQTRTYKKYTPQDKENLFHLVREKGMSTTAAATQLGINPSTAQSWVRKDRENPQPVPVQTHRIDPSPVPVPAQTTDQHVSEKEGYEQSVPESVKAKRTYKKYTAQDKENLFHLVKDTGMSTRGAAMQLGINPSTAQSWVKKDREETAALSEEQEEFLTTKISEQGVLTLDEMLESLNIEFKGLDVSKTALCNFAMKKYTICFTL